MWLQRRTPQRGPCPYPRSLEQGHLAKERECLRNLRHYLVLGDLVGPAERAWTSGQDLQQLHAGRSSPALEMEEGTMSPGGCGGLRPGSDRLPEAGGDLGPTTAGSRILSTARGSRKWTHPSASVNECSNGHTWTLAP